MHDCTECSWSMDGDDQTTKHERNQRAIEHHIETGHSIVARSPPIRQQGPTVDGSEGGHQPAE